MSALIIGHFGGQPHPVLAEMPAHDVQRAKSAPLAASASVEDAIKALRCEILFAAEAPARDLKALMRLVEMHGELVALRALETASRQV